MSSRVSAGVQVPTAYALRARGGRGSCLAPPPTVFWLHRLKPKPDATVVLKAGDYPLLVTGQFGKGKVALFAGTPMGKPGKGQTPFWKWDGWTALLKNLVTWLEAK